LLPSVRHPRRGLRSQQQIHHLLWNAHHKNWTRPPPSTHVLLSVLINTFYPCAHVHYEMVGPLFDFRCHPYKERNRVVTTCAQWIPPFCKKPFWLGESFCENQLGPHARWIICKS
jgi:hypothetical protein